MGIPVIIATAAACGSLVTTVKSGWELSRMIRRKRDQRQAEEDAARVYRSLRRALHSGRMSDKEYDHWLEKFLIAESEKNLAGLRKIRAHLRIINDGSEKRSRHNGSRNSKASNSGGSSNKTYRDYDDGRPRQSVRFDMRQTYYVPDPPQRYQDVEWPQSAGSIEYFPLKDQFPTKEKDEPDVARLARLQRSASVSYQPPDRPHDTRSRGESTTRHEKERGRSRRREARNADAHADTDSSDESYHEKLGYRSKR